jgi:hypothetical protein
MQIQRTIGNRAVGKLFSGIGNTSAVQLAAFQKQEIPEKEALQGKMIVTVQLKEAPEEEEPLQIKSKKIPEYQITSRLA